MATLAEQIKSNPKMAALKIQNQLRTGKRKSTYKVRDGDSWSSIAGRAYADIYGGDQVQAQRMFGDLMRANPNVKWLTPGMTIRLARPRTGPVNVSPGLANYVGMAPGTGGGNAPTTQQAGQQAPQQAQQVIQPTLLPQNQNLNVPGNPNAPSYWTTPQTAQPASTRPPKLNAPAQVARPAGNLNVPGNPNAPNYWTSRPPVNTVNRAEPGTGGGVGGAVGGTQPSGPFVPVGPPAPGGGSPTGDLLQPVPDQPVTVIGLGGQRAYGTSIVDYLLRNGIEPLTISPYEVRTLGINTNILIQMGYTQNDWGEWIRPMLAPGVVAGGNQFSSNPFYGGGWYARGRGGGGGGGSGRGGYGSAPTSTGRMSAREIGPISWRI